MKIKSRSEVLKVREPYIAPYYDVMIIGGGVIGSFISYQLSKYNIKVCLVEMEADVAMQESGANSAIIHAGFDAKPDTNKAKFNLLGNEMMEEVCRNLCVTFERNGAMVLAFSSDEYDSLVKLYERGTINGVNGLKLLSRDQAIELEPLLSHEIYGALFAPTSGIVSPFELTLAASEVANQNGVEFFFEHKVIKIEKIILDDTEYKLEDMTDKKNGTFKVTCKIPKLLEFEKGVNSPNAHKTNECDASEKIVSSGEEFVFKKSDTNEIPSEICYIEKTINCKFIINAAGVHADKISNMAGDFSYKIIPRKGEYIVLDKSIKEKVNNTIFQVPSQKGKGVLVTRTVEGNMLVGPNSTIINDPFDDTTTQEGLSEIWELGKKSVPSLDKKFMIRSFAGIRSTPSTEDFIVGESDYSKGFFHAAGIESPGLTSSPAIAIEIERIVIESFSTRPVIKDNYHSKRKVSPRFCEVSREEQQEMIARNPDYAKIVCRCESVTLAEIIDSINRPLGATTVNGVKLRTRAGMGRCQSGFCLPKILDIISNQLDLPMETVSQFGTGSEIIKGRTR